MQLPGGYNLKQLLKQFIIGQKRFFFFFGLLGICLILSACNETSNTVENDSEYSIYYINSGDTKIVNIPYTPIGTSTEALIEEYLEELQKDTNNVSYKKTIPDSITLKEYQMGEDNQLSLYFDAGYMSISKVSEVLMRAAVVKTLCQIEGINAVEFYVNGQPLMNTNEKPIGFMKAEEFIDNTGLENDYLQDTTMTLFFADEKGKSLKEKSINVEFDGSTPMEQLIIELLITGPDIIQGLSENELFPTIPENTVLLKATTKDGVCYVDFNEKFLDKIPGITNEVAIYSVVNSLVELPEVNKVKFWINGEEKKYYRDNIAFDQFFERNLDIVKSGSK